MGSMSRFGLMALTLATFTLTTGCTSGRLKQERDALYIQNQELQEELTRARMALDESEQRRMDMQSDRDRLQGQLADAAAAPTYVDNSSTNKFDAIPGVEAFERDGEIAVRVEGDVLFSSGKVDLKSSAKSTLGRVAGILKSDYAGQTIRIEGYTDSDPIKKSKWKDNLELSLQRAAAVQRYLKQQGIPSSRMYSAGFGSNKSQASKSKSRRVEIVVIQ